MPGEETTNAEDQTYISQKSKEEVKAQWGHRSASLLRVERVLLFRDSSARLAYFQLPAAFIWHQPTFLEWPVVM